MLVGWDARLTRAFTGGGDGDGGLAFTFPAALPAISGATAASITTRREVARGCATSMATAPVVLVSVAAAAAAAAPKAVTALAAPLLTHASSRDANGVRSGSRSPL